MAWFKKNWLLLITHIAAWMPFIWLLTNYWLDRLSINPVQDLTFGTGETAIRLLILSLACTPLHIIFGWRQVVPLRKWLGLYAFMYALLHFLVFIGLDYRFNLELILADDIVQKPYIIVGFLALLMLLPLALTSNTWAMRTLKKNWKRLHQTVYLAGILALLHFMWVRKADVDPEVVIYGIVLLLLLTVRIPKIRKAITTFRRKQKSAAV